MISLDLMKLSEVRKAGDRSDLLFHRPINCFTVQLLESSVCFNTSVSQQNHFFGNGHSVCLSMLLPIKIHGISPYLEKQRGLLLFGLQPPPFTFNVFFEQVLK